ncbi:MULTISPECIES: class I SAM-dependent methyltransferase [Aeromonas]|uniref:class I SAM-dependent methyltransferase n=1 Tax=Aeromonas TaxID=642 RepID=UPI00029A2F97|nr:MULTISPECIES: methyltransferase domain-containing protein [Aeromonas]MBQ4670830.1 methyltransferase domain-containing protein [Aeromonas dhakensis]MDX7833252.1 methyltransferase domain-containing protein [Aeromonas dhakensis]QXA16250.1 methyltransferase domain-containing protein [Aeromonas sp. FDAARGOS 1403]HDX8642546.1 methyltransferase domain-containing protein [Aeromonas dhakensis]HDZ8894972.1 methyltransferase domain-containing protein [Aeromonas dhakensis]
MNIIDYINPFYIFGRIKRYIRIALLRRTANLLWKRLSINSVIKLELGSGTRKGCDGWTTVDLYGADINYDLRRGIPLGQSSVDMIYTSHMLEHFNYNDLIIFIKECYRVLKPSGKLLVCVPNSRCYIEAYIDGHYFRDPNDFYQPARIDTGSLIDQVNYVAYMSDQHKYMFDEENLVNTLKKVEFSSVLLRSFDGSIDIKDREYGSIYAVAVK